MTDDDVLVQIHAAGVNLLDSKVTDGEFKLILPYRLPLILGSDVATIAQIVAATGWQPHTVRGAFAGALKKKLGLTVTSEKVEGASGSTGSKSDAGAI